MSSSLLCLKSIAVKPLKLISKLARTEIAPEPAAEQRDRQQNVKRSAHTRIEDSNAVMGDS